MAVCCNTSDVMATVFVVIIFISNVKYSRKTFSYILYIYLTTSLVVQWSETLTTNHEVPGSIPGSTVGIFLEGGDSRCDYGLGRLVEFRFKAPLGTTSSITTHTPSGQRNCASWASQPQKSVTFLPWTGGRTTKSTKGMWWHWGGGYLNNLMANIFKELDLIPNKKCLMMACEQSRKK